MIDSFRNEYFFLSNFWPGDQTSLEHKYQAAKFLDEALKARIMSCEKPGAAKLLARKFKKQGLQRNDWEQVNIGIMESLLREKFSNPSLAEKLLATNSEELIEGNWWGDRFWGCVRGYEGSKWIGENNFGKLLMKIRSELVNQQIIYVNAD